MSLINLLEKDNSVSIHHKNLQALAIEMFKIHTKTSPGLMQELFLVKEQGNYNFQTQTDFIIPQVKSVSSSLESIGVLGPKICEVLPNDLKNKESVENFKNATKRWKPENRFTEHKLLVKRQVLLNEDESITYRFSTKFTSIVGLVSMD